MSIDVEGLERAVKRLPALAECSVDLFRETLSYEDYAAEAQADIRALLASHAALAARVVELETAVLDAAISDRLDEAGSPLSWREVAEAAERRAGELEGALREAEATLALVEHPRREDPIHGGEVNALGARIGYGALMASAQASWRAHLEASGDPLGGEYVAGPCFATVQDTLRVIRSALLPATQAEGE